MFEHDEADVVERPDYAWIDFGAKRRGGPDRRAEHQHPGGKNTAD
jgi:hypothetical protein